MGRKIKDLSGSTIGHWKVISRDGSTPDGKMPMFLCECVCGTRRRVRAGNLRNGLSVSCGCIDKKPRSVLPKVEIGDLFGRMLVIDRLPESYVLCKCECGTIKPVYATNLTLGKIQSCGCLHSEKLRERSFRHGMIDHPAHRSWQAAKSRCTNPNDQDFAIYGGRGIKFWSPWEDFTVFWSDMGSKWFEGATLDRKDGNGDYCPTNCRWITIRDQQRNKKTNVMVQSPWGVLPLVDVAEHLGISAGTLWARLNSGWTGSGLIVRLGTREEIGNNEIPQISPQES
jgi:hypothetical protein